MSRPLVVSTFLAVTAWLAWPWIAPSSPAASTPAGSPDLLVLLDGTPSRRSAAERIAAGLPQPPRRLLIRCPRGASPSQQWPVLLQGFDTVTQVTALAQWLRHQPHVSRVWIATDRDHTARAVLLAHIALGSQGIRVFPASPPPPSSSERRKLWRDALRLTLWRATGSTGGWLAPDALARKQAACGV